MIDKNHLNSLSELLGRDTVNQIRLEYVEDSFEKLTLLQQAWQDKNYPELAHISHSLKSASLNMAMQLFAEQCQKIEKAASQHSDQDLQDIIEKLPAIRQASLEELEIYFSS
ncbi:histidine kinase [Marinomonas sp. CT5]|uniref:Hpt domain-containing protein n=1 Tax=Marinomonas sp. CT5 TaxID=2066133 RepID=UPI00179EAEC7|nr:Hpt domain-containing protein [Marinomonas sp. CT5]NVK75061.1 Hpt domain-containing protein [Oceanospirillaceae bacterium]QUX97918.1 histidine kinase [Marinomonas sp. CT5]